MAEYRVSIYGRKQSEWDQLASWFINNAIYSENAVWLIQVIFNVVPFLMEAALLCVFSHSSTQLIRVATPEHDDSYH